MSQIQISSRVAINSFKFKGQEGIVKFVGEVEDKGIGLWVGVELDQPKGDMDGTMNGKFLFECKPGHGLLLRSTQVKILSASSAQPDIPELKFGGGERGLSDSPLLTPKDPPMQQLMDKLVQQKPLFQQQQIQQQQQMAQPTDGGGDAPKTQSWRDRLEILRKQKEMKKQADSEPPQEEIKKEVQDLKQVIAPQPGITRNRDGQLSVNKEEAKSFIQEKKIQQQQMSQVIEVPEPIEVPEVQEEKKKQGALVQKIGSGLKQATGISKIGQPKTQGTIGGKTTTAVDAAKEKVMKKNEEVKAKLDGRASEVGKPGGTTTTGRATLGRSTTSVLPGEKGKTDASSKLESTVGKGLKLGGLKQPGAGSTKAQDTTTTAAEKPSQQRPLTARGNKEENKNEAANTSSAVKKPGHTRQGSQIDNRSTTRSKLGMQKTDEIGGQKSTIIEEEEEQQQPQIKPINKADAKSPSKVVGKAFQERMTYQPDLQQQQPLIEQPVFGGVSQAEFKKIEGDLRKKKEEVYSLQMEVKELSQRITDLQRDHNDKIEEVKTEYEIKILELDSKLNDNTLLQKVEGQHKDLQSQLQAQIDELKRQKNETEQQLMSQKQGVEQQLAQQKKLLEAAEQEKNRLQEEVEAKLADIEIIQLENEALRDEKEELLNQMKIASEVNDQSALAGLSEDELKNQNSKLRQAISTLTMNFEVEKSRFQTKIQELEQRAKLVDDYEKKLNDMDLLIEEVELKDQEIKAMEEKLDECLEFEKMVEEMAEELLKKEEENDELQARIAELEEMNAVQEELNENQEQYILELNEDIANKDAEISEFETNVAQLEDMVLDQDQKIQKYKEKCQQLNQKCTMLQEELQSAYAAGDQKVKISTLIEKQNQLISKLREAGKKDLEIMVHKIEFWQEKLKMKVVEGFIPKRLTEETRLDALEKIQLLNTTKNKALLLTREICEKQLQGIEQLHDDKEQQVMYARLLINISENSIKFIDHCSRIMNCIYRMPIEKYHEVTKLSAWQKFLNVKQFIDRLMELIKEEALSPKFDISVYTESIKGIGDLQYTIESRFIEKTKEEKAEEEKSGEKAFDLSIAQQDRQREVKYCQKLNLRNEALKMALAIISLSILNQAKTEETQTKCKLIYWRLLDIIYKIDSIDGQDNGQDYLNLEELGTDSRLDQKYNTIKVLWSNEPQSEQEPQERDWSYVLEAIERDITSLNNDYKFKKLIAKIENEFKDQQIHIDDIYSKGWDNKGPWTLIVDKVRQDLEDTEAMKNKIEVLQEKVKDQAMQYLILKREKEELQAVGSSLEKRLADAQSKAEKVPALEMEKKRLQEKEQYFNQQIELAKKEIESMREKEKEMSSKLQEIESNPNFGRESFKGYNKKNTNLPSTSNQQARQSRTSHFFNQIAKSSLLNKRDSVTTATRSNTSISSSELQKQLQITEEVFTSVILELQKDRLMLRGQQMQERLNKLEKSDGSFNQFILKQREKKQAIKRLTKDEQNKLENAIEKVEGLKTKVKKEMALIKVIDLTKKEQAQEQQKGEEFIETSKEKINYMIVKAKDQVNDAFKVLFAKDSKLHQLKNLVGQQPLSAIDTALIEKQVDNDEKVKIGSIKVNGLPERKIINLNPLMVKDLKTNLSVFAHS